MSGRPIRLALIVSAMVLGCKPASDTTKQATPEAGPQDTRPIETQVSADSAWAALTTQLHFGPRVPGTEAHRRCGDWMIAELKRYGARVEEDTFSYSDTVGTTWPLRNILGHLGPAGNGRLLLVAHWDTRPWADEDPDPARRNQPIPGASDGASGVAVLLEVARVMQGETLPRGVDILFADGEDLGRHGHPEGYCRGTRRFAERPLTAYWRGIVLDLVGDNDLHLKIEQYSLARAPDVVDWIWQRGAALAPDVFSQEMDGAIFDDHIPLLDAGLPAADVIDLDYGPWHTHADDAGAVSAASLVAVARVVASLAHTP
ncbi:MAG TPA: M28 family peptidase [Dongiaceae bacterium]|nr:M28 family peptidase [Dongiaceae bacterium]